MKKIIFLFPALIFAEMMSAQKTTPKTAPATPPAMKTIIDSASYAIGTNVGIFYKQQGIDKLNAALVMKGINDVFGNRKLLLDDNTTNELMNRMMNNMQQQKVAKTIKEGETFLAENKKRKEVKVTASGLQYEMLKDTTGYKPTAMDTFVCHYRGRLLNGSEFDNSYNKGQPLVWPMQRVITGWLEGLQLMSIGSKFKLYIPYQLGYGLYGNEPSIPGGSVLIFDMELLDVKKYQVPTPQPDH